MKRLIQGTGKNSSDEYDRIYKERKLKGVNWADKRRWKYMIKYFRGGKLLDIGCLDSNICELAVNQDDFTIAVGIDTTEEAINDLIENRKDPRIRYLVQDLHNHDGMYDYICMGEVLEHLEDPKKAILKALNMLNKNGILAISVPYNEAIEPGAVDGHRHIWSFTEYDFRDIIDLGYNVNFKILGSRYFPTYRYCFKQLLVYIKKI